MQKSMEIALGDDESKEIDPVNSGAAGGIPEAELDRLSSILSSFHEQYGNISWEDADRIRRDINCIPHEVSKDAAYQNAMRNSDKENAYLEGEKAFNRVVVRMFNDNAELAKQIYDNTSFATSLLDSVLRATYNLYGNPLPEDLQLRI